MQKEIINIAIAEKQKELAEVEKLIVEAGKLGIVAKKVNNLIK